MKEPDRHLVGTRPSFPTSALDYDLPEDLVAQAPTAERGASRMLVVDRASGVVADRVIADLPAYTRQTDRWVLNDTRVLPAKFTLRRSTGGRIEGLYLQADDAGRWLVLLKGAQRLRVGETLAFEPSSGSAGAVVDARGERGHWWLRVEGGTPAEILNTVGRMPLPPYIKRGKEADERDGADHERYQTVFAVRDGAVAAPTAGLHFTPELLDALSSRCRGLSHVTLHVGYGTFAPLEVDDLADHDMHVEAYSISDGVCSELRACRSAGGRVVAVGTTSARVLETAWRQNRWAGGAEGTTGLFCYPPYVFRGVDVLLTNFHLPRSTLLALVMSFAGEALTRKAYAHAIQQKYRFYSYGDAMLIL